MRWGIYVRISQDRTGQRAGVERQLEDCRKVIASEDPEAVVTVYEDDDRSAYSDKRNRPAYDKLCTAVASGDLDMVAAWHIDRMWRDRDGIERGTFFMLAREGGVKAVVTPSARFDPADADDSFLASILAAVASKESGDKSRRIKRKHAELARNGQYHGGTPGYGHDAVDGNLIVNPEEARHIRDAARRVLRGETLGSVVRDWNAQGLVTRRGGPWAKEVLRRLLTAPRLAGLRSHNGETFPATWKPILSEADHKALCAILAAGRNTGTRRLRKNLLSGILRCHKCGSTMTGCGLRYLCQGANSGVNGCTGTGIKLDRTDSYVTDELFRYLDSREFRAALKRASRALSEGDTGLADALAQRDRDRAALTALTDEFDDGKISTDEYRRRRTRLESRIMDADRSIGRFADSLPASADYAGRGAELRKDWESMTLAERREILDALVSGIVIGPSTDRSRFQAERIVITWRFASS